MIRRIAALVLVLVAAAAVAAASLLYAPLPSRRGLVSLPRLTAPVEVRFDRAGVPHVTAVLEDDAWRTLGWLHASERLFQMEMRRRAASGRLAEIFGQELLPFDTEARAWGHVRGAEADLAAVSDRERRVLEAYSGGVNAFLEEEPLPLELQALAVVPEPWTPRDTLAFGRLMYRGLTVAGSHEHAAFTDALLRGIDAAVAAADAADGGRTEVLPEMRDALGALPLSAGVRTVFDRDESASGSNAWALAGTRTASGKPLLAGDPHLNAERPAIWYAAHLSSADGLSVTGLTLAGVPAVLIGHNGAVAWSIAMNQADDVDLYLERAADAGIASEETIGVKGGAPVVVPIRASRHGPVVEELPGGMALARAWASADLRHGIEVHLRAARARDGRELREAWTGYRGPAVNLCFADASGSIGVAAFGAVPRRSAGEGRFPLPGWVDGYDWRGLLAPEELPSIVDPPEGYVATANDDWSAAGARLDYPGHFAEADRVRRARELASRLSKAGIGDMRAMQADVYSPYAARVVASLAALPLADARAVRARSVLQSWDKRVQRRGPALLFFSFLRRLRHEVDGPEAPGTSGAWATWSLLDRMVSGAAPEELFGGSRDRAVTRALIGALEEVERSDGRDPARWSWGRVHRLSYPHPLGSGLPPFVGKRLAFRPVELPGEWHTLDVAGFRLRGDDYAVVHIPSARLVVDLGDVDASRLCLPLGQSGQVLDRHARDHQRRWTTVRDFAWPFTPKAVAAATVSTMSFVPAP